MTLGTFFEGPFVNPSGQILLIASVEGPGIDPAKNKVVWLIEPDLPGRRVAWPGMAVTLPDGSTVILDGVGYGSGVAAHASGDDDGRGSMLNDHGEVVFIGTWQSGANLRSGVFVARPAGPRLELRRASDGTLELRFQTAAGATSKSPITSRSSHPVYGTGRDATGLWNSSRDSPSLPPSGAVRPRSEAVRRCARGDGQY